MNHGVSSSLLERLKHETEEFFMLPLEEKTKYKARTGDFEGYGTIIRCKDQKLDWGDRLYMIINPTHRRKPYLFPELPSSLRFSLSHMHTHHYFLNNVRDIKILLHSFYKLMCH